MQRNPATSNDFITLLDKSGLLQPDEIAALQVQSNDGPQDAREVAAELVKRGRLTSYQAEHLLAGRSGGFFLGKYKILEPLGKGGMGAVFRAEDTVLRREVALKLLPHHASQEPRTVARFQREARLAAQLQHENIVAVYDVGEERRKHFISMELVPGRDLARLLQDKGRLGPPEAVRIIAQVAKGLAFALQQGIIHRDIKPPNIVVSPHNKAKILDLVSAAAARDAVILSGWRGRSPKLPMRFSTPISKVSFTVISSPPISCLISMDGSRSPISAWPASWRNRVSRCRANSWERRGT